MKKTAKKIFSISLTVIALSLLSACSTQTESPSNKISVSTSDNKITKNKSESLPIDYFVKPATEGYISMKISNIEWVNNNNENQLLFSKAYKTDSSFNFKNYKLLKLYVEETLPVGVDVSFNTSKIILTDNADIVLGENSQSEIYPEIKSQLETLTYQHLSDRINVDKDSVPLKAEFLLAIPKELANNKNLQLKIIKEETEDNSYETYYIDLN